MTSLYSNIDLKYILSFGRSFILLCKLKTKNLTNKYLFLKWKNCNSCMSHHYLFMLFSFFHRWIWRSLYIYIYGKTNVLKCCNNLHVYCREPGENHRPVASHWQTLSHNVVHLALIKIRTHNISGDTCKIINTLL
jgi:hypothetical protein